MLWWVNRSGGKFPGYYNFVERGKFPGDNPVGGKFPSDYAVDTKYISQWLYRSTDNIAVSAV